MSIKIFFCFAHYDHEDRRMALELRNHLSVLEHRGLITVWEYGDIQAGAVWEQEVKKHLVEAQFILFLISSSFLASKCYYSKDVQWAIERHERKDARVIPNTPS